MPAPGGLAALGQKDRTKSEGPLARALTSNRLHRLCRLPGDLRREAVDPRIQAIRPRTETAPTVSDRTRPDRVSDLSHTARPYHRHFERPRENRVARSARSRQEPAITLKEFTSSCQADSASSDVAHACSPSVSPLPVSPLEGEDVGRSLPGSRGRRSGAAPPPPRVKRCPASRDRPSRPAPSSTTEPPAAGKCPWRRPAWRG